MNLIKLKENLYVPKDFETNHKYFADPEGKKPYTGITSILEVLAKPQLIGWAARMAVEYISDKSSVWFKEGGTAQGFVEHLDGWLDEARTAHTRKKEAAGTHGTDAHALVEEYVKRCLSFDGKPRANVMADPDAIKISKFIEWSIINVDHFLFSERRMCDPERFIAGTSDFAAIMKDGKKLMGDFKTSSGIYGIDYWLQVAAYRMLAEGEGDEPYDGSVVVRLGKDGKFEVQYRYAYETDRNAFLACLTLYKATKTWEKTKI